MFNLTHSYLNEELDGFESAFAGETGEIGESKGKGEGEDIESSNLSKDELKPEYLFGDVTAEEAGEQFGYLRGLPETLRGLESRVSETVSPVMDQLTKIQESLGSQPVFNPKLDRFSRVLAEYDPKLAEAVLPALVEDLKESLAVNPLSAESLTPFVDPMLASSKSAIFDEIIPFLADALPFDPNGVINREDPSAPKTDLQKYFAKWWAKTDTPTRQALETVGIPYMRAMQQFGREWAEFLRRKGEAAGKASERLGQSAQTNSGSRRQSTSKGLQSEEEGFNSVFGG